MGPPGLWLTPAAAGRRVGHTGAPPVVNMERWVVWNLLQYVDDGAERADPAALPARTL